MLYSKNGSIPKPETDGTEGWIEVDMPPEAPEGKEVVWLNWQWVVRNPKPVDREGYRWKWNHDGYQWIEYQLPQTIVLDTEQVVSISSAQVDALSSAGIVTLTSEQISGL
jgi:hypothetical protein